jgi:Pentapeptide repeats (8 copies)
MAERLRGLQKVRNEIKKQVKEVLDKEIILAAEKAFEHVEREMESRFLPVEKKMIFFQMIVSDLQEYNYWKYLKKGSRGYTILEQTSLFIFSTAGFMILFVGLAIGVSFMIKRIDSNADQYRIILQLLIPLASLFVLYFGAGVVSKRTIESSFIKEIDDMFVRINANWTIFANVMNKRDAIPDADANSDGVKILEGNYGMADVLQFFASLANTPYEANMQNMKLQGLDLRGGKYKGIKLIAADCRYTNFSDCNLLLATFDDAIFDHANFDDAILSVDAFKYVASAKDISLNGVLWIE